MKMGTVAAMSILLLQIPHQPNQPDLMNIHNNNKIQSTVDKNNTKTITHPNIRRWKYKTSF